MAGDTICTSEKISTLKKRISSFLQKPEHEHTDEELSSLQQLIEKLETCLANAEASHRIYRDLYDLAPVGQLVVNSKGIITRANLSAAEMLNVTKAELTGNHLPDFIDPADHATYTAYHNRLISNGKKALCTLRLKRQNGDEFLTGILTGCQENGDGSPGDRHIQMTITDITQLTESESALRTAAWKYKTIADSNCDWTYLLSHDGKLQYISPSCERLTGYSREDFTRHPQWITTIVHPDYADKVAHHCKEELCKEGRVHLMYKIVTKDGVEKWVSHLCQPVYNVDGTIIGRQANIRDISEIKELELSLKKQKNLLRTILDACSDDIWEYNTTTGEYHLFDHWYHIFGYTLKDVQEKKLSWNKLVHPEDIEIKTQAIKDHLNGKTERYNVKYRMLNKDGTWRWILSRGKAFDPDEKGRPQRIVGTHVDITARKNAEEALIQAKSDQEKIIQERTAEVEETNIALNVLLRNKDKDSLALQEQLVDGLGLLVEPYIAQLESSGLSLQQQQLLDILKQNLMDITQTFTRFMPNLHKLSAMELKVANLVKLGHSTKDIAGILHLAPGTISAHRRSIRKKLEITNKKENLQSVLGSIFMS